MRPLPWLIVACLLGSGLGCSGRAALPNVVLILVDDLGYGDLGSYGGTSFTTPMLDRMAAEGVRLDDFYAGAPSCTASRAALLTGSYPVRIGLEGILFPNAPTGLARDEITLAEILHDRGYRTACVGKWHLGDREDYLPWNHGFEHTFFVPYSHDMRAAIPLFRDGLPIRALTDHPEVTQLFTDDAVAFILDDDPRPFFLYLAYPMPHKPLRVSPRFAGSSGVGAYGDVVRELDASVGELLAALAERGVERETLVIFTSDNGPWHPGSAGRLRGRKGGSLEGAVRVPFLARWPGRLPAGHVSAELATAMDLLPTIARLAGAPVPDDRTLDGRDIWPLLSGAPGATSPHEAFYYYRGSALCAVRSGRWKLHLCDPPALRARALEVPLLVDLVEDPAELHDRAAERPDEVARLLALAERAREELGDQIVGRVGRGVRATWDERATPPEAKGPP